MHPEQPATAPEAALAANIIRHHKDNPNLWEVRLRSDAESHWVEQT